MRVFTCSTCGKEWPENYCPECAHTIHRTQLEQGIPKAITQPDPVPALVVPILRKEPSAQPTSQRPRHTSALIGSLAVIVAYTLVRAGVYHFYPVTSLETWYNRVVLMNIPRLGALDALLLLNRCWNLARFDLPLKDFRRAVFLGFVPVAVWLFYFSGGDGQQFTPTMMMGGFLTSLIVGAYEEYAFRGPMLFALRERMSLLATVMISSALFTIYHIQAQRLDIWPTIFLTGVILANLRFRGLSIGWLALIHAVIDTYMFIFPTNTVGPFGFHGLVMQSGLLVYGILTFPRSQITEPKPSP